MQQDGFWVRNFPAAWILGEVRLTLSLLERGVYWDAFQFVLVKGSLPADGQMLQRLLGLTEEEFRQTWPNVGKHFHTDPDDPTRLLSSEATALIDERRGFIDAKRKAGAAGGRPKKTTAEPARSQASPAVNHNGTSAFEPGSRGSEAETSGFEVEKQTKPKQTNRQTDSVDTASFQNLPEEPFEVFQGWFTGPVEQTAWREFGQQANTPERLQALMANGPLWMQEKRYRDGYHGASAFLRSGVWLTPPKGDFVPTYYPRLDSYGEYEAI